MEDFNDIYMWLGMITFWMGAIYGILGLIATMANMLYKRTKIMAPFFESILQIRKYKTWLANKEYQEYLKNKGDKKDG